MVISYKQKKLKSSQQPIKIKVWINCDRNITYCNGSTTANNKMIIKTLFLRNIYQKNVNIQQRISGKKKKNI